jgi:O-antigen/teichoic acid export membrane protein
MTGGATQAEAALARQPRPPARGGNAAGDLRPVVASGVVRALLLPLSAVLTLGTSTLLVDAVGATAYGAVIFVGTLFQLLPFADLGVGGAVTRAVAASDDPQHDVFVQAVVRRSLRILLVSGGVLSAVAILIGIAGVWGPILGLDGQVSHANLVSTATLVIFALGLPLALGQRVLLGYGKNHLAVATGVVQPVVALLLTVFLWAFQAPAAAFVLVFPIGLIAGSTATSLLARRLTGLRLSPFAALRPVPAGDHPPARVMDIAVPLFLLSVGLPLGLQSDKIVISHRLPPGALSEYALCSQLYLPGWLVLSASAFALLPVFTRRRAHGIPHRQLFWRLTAIFGALSLAIGAAFVLLAPFVADLISSGHVQVGLDLRIAFAALLIVQTSGLVSGMVLNRPEEMKIQAACVMAMMVSNLALSWWLAAAVGVAGPVIASAVTVGVCMTLVSGIRAARS